MKTAFYTTLVVISSCVLFSCGKNSTSKSTGHLTVKVTVANAVDYHGLNPASSTSITGVLYDSTDRVILDTKIDSSSGSPKNLDFGERNPGTYQLHNSLKVVEPYSTSPNYPAHVNSPVVSTITIIANQDKNINLDY